MQASAYLEGLITSWVRGTAFPAAPSTLYLALSSSNPGDAGAGVVEPAGGSYARQEITFPAPVSNEVNGSVTSNDAPILFAGMPAFTATHVAIYDDSGNMLMYGELRVLRVASSGDTISFDTGTLSAAIRGRFSKFFAEAVIGWLRGNAMPAAPSSLKIGLSKGTVLRDGSGYVAPLGGAAYAAQALVFDDPAYTLGVGTTMYNEFPIVFGPATSSWGVIVSAVIFTDTDQPLFIGALSAPKEIRTGEGFGFNAGAIGITVR